MTSCIQHELPSKPAYTGIYNGGNLLSTYYQRNETIYGYHIQFNGNLGACDQSVKTEGIMPHL